MVEKPTKCESGHSLNLVFQAKPREVKDGNFASGEDIVCNVCFQKIVLDEGYFTCMDVCDYDVHKSCCGGITGDEDLDLVCKKRHKLVKRKPGF